MKGLIDDRRSMHTKRFVGRCHELKLLKGWLEDSEAPFRIFAISGTKGIGKSTLMAEMMRISLEFNAYGIWMDGCSLPQTPSGFLECLSAAIRLEAVDKNFSHSLEPLMGANPENRAVLCIDNFEKLALLEGWLLEAFISKLPLSGMLLILASCPELPFTWKLNTSLSRYIVELPLAYFSFGEMSAYIRQAAPLCQDREGEIIRASHGHPLALAMAVEEVMNQKGRCTPNKMVLSQIISSQILKELPSSDLQPIIDVLVVLGYANQEMLSLMLDKQVATKDYQMLQGISFINVGTEGLVLHKSARIHLLRDLKLREPKRQYELRTKAAAILNKQFQTAGQSKQRRIASQMLWLCKDIFPLHSLYVDLTIDNFDSPLEPMITEDLPALHDLLSSWCEYSIDPLHCDTYHQFLDQLVESFPESINILRGKDKQPIAMFISILLYDETSQFLIRYFPAEIKECFKAEELVYKQNEADTYYAVLAAATNHFPGYTRQELIGLMALDSISLLGQGFRAVLVATNPDLKLFLKQLGFLMRPTLARDCDTSSNRADILELDLRKKNFGTWIMSFIKENSEQIRMVPSAELTEKEIRKLLSSLHSPSKLQAFVPFFLGEKNGLHLQEHILSLLTSEESGLSEQDRNLLYVTYYMHSNNRIAAMNTCSMSRATFYRHLNNAIANFTQLLKVKK